ncbi:hypothetical protein DPMN_065650 [Dreissena polymorpha]|uniref:Uncharacterized protein n=1 Tax=Dreissena polymorpha TaxID=45954 RepID=A0A9D4BRG1_DREPO|nr:hypothetical protein DPMN_065650 [Dreissena polymorpha]
MRHRRQRPGGPHRSSSLTWPRKLTKKSMQMKRISFGTNSTAFMRTSSLKIITGSLLSSQNWPQSTIRAPKTSPHIL